MVPSQDLKLGPLNRKFVALQIGLYRGKVTAGLVESNGSLPPGL